MHGGGNCVRFKGVRVLDGTDDGVETISSVHRPWAGGNVAELLLVQRTELLGNGGRDVGDQRLLRHEASLCYVDSSDLDEIVVDSGVSTDKRAGQTGVTRLTDQQTGFGIVACVVPDVGIGVAELGD